MEPSRVEAIKNAIRANFDDSPRDYDEFEKASGLFAFLAGELASCAGVAEGQRVVDVGCGTGISTVVLSGIVGPGGRATGIDISRGMLGLARTNASGRTNVEFIEGDAADLGSILAGRAFDAVLYNACIFLVPDAEKSIEGAFSILRPGGTVAMNHIGGAFIDGKELFTELFPDWTGGGTFPAPRFPADIAGLRTMTAAAGFSGIRTGTVERALPLEHLQRFYQVPAQSASLYPKLSLAERRSAVERMFACARQKGVRVAEMRWVWITGRK